MLNAAHIIIADDDPDDQFFFREAIESAFGDLCKVSAVNNGAELLHWISDPLNRLPDVIVLDLNMPVKDGLSVLRELKAEERYRNIPVFILSTSKRPDDVSTCIELGCSSYYSKPFHLHEYQQIVTDMLGKKVETVS
jgi:CheY-like chemotaxis protein